MAEKFSLGKWSSKQVKKATKLISLNAVNTVLKESNTSLTSLKQVAKDNAEKMQIEASEKQIEANKLLTRANILTKNFTEIHEALDELGKAEGKH